MPRGVTGAGLFRAGGSESEGAGVFDATGGLCGLAGDTLHPYACQHILAAPIHSVEGGWHGIRGGWGGIEGPSLAWREEEHGGAVEERRSIGEVDVRGAVRLEQDAVIHLARWMARV